MSWRYGCVRKTYKTILPDGEESTEIWYQTHEVYVDDKGNVEGWTEEPVDISVDGSKENLVVWLRKAADDIEKNPMICDEDVVINDLRGIS